MSGSSGTTNLPIPKAITPAGAKDPGGLLQPLNLDGSGNLMVTGSFTPPAGGATSANQTTQIGLETQIRNNQTNGTQQTQIVGTVPLPTGSATAANQVIEINAINSFSGKSASAFVNSPFDETVITYVGATTSIATVTYKLATVTVNTLTMSYDGSNRLIGVVKT